MPFKYKFSISKYHATKSVNILSIYRSLLHKEYKEIVEDYSKFFSCFCFIKKIATLTDQITPVNSRLIQRMMLVNRQRRASFG